MNAYAVVLFLHFCALFAAFAASALVHFAESRLSTATTIAEARGWSGMLSRVVRTFPAAMLVLVVTGAYMVHAAWNWHAGWVDAGLVGIGLLAINGPIVAGSRHRRIARALAAAGDGAMAPELAASLHDPVLRAATWGNTLVALGVVLVMVAKPALEEALWILVVALLAGIAITLPFRRRRDASAAATG